MKSIISERFDFMACLAISIDEFKVLAQTSLC